jgi:adenosine deaminase CECR1
MRKTNSTKNLNGTSDLQNGTVSRNRSGQRQSEQPESMSDLGNARSTRSSTGPRRKGTQSSQTSSAPMPDAEERRQAATMSLNKNIKSNTRAAKYHEQRHDLLTQEQENYWDAKARSTASATEREAQKVLVKIREYERRDPELYGDLPSEALPDTHSRDMGGRFLANKDRIDRSKIFRASQMMPKGAHQHLHFNSELPPEVLFPHARSPQMQDTMFIRSTAPLATRAAFDDTEIVFNVFPATTPSANIFSKTYNPNAKDPDNNPWMLWREFRRQFPTRNAAREPVDLEPAERWARLKMVVTAERAYSGGQTHNRAWACFNQGTRAFKGLVGYESVYRWYIGHIIDSMIDDKVMYAELRPMLLDKTMPSDDGLRKLGHREQMQIICEEVAKKRSELESMDQLDKFPFGLKIIYCTPRSIPLTKMESELDDCIQLKLRFPDLICGFDLVGAEDRPNSVGFYADLLLAFQETCSELKISIPFMFHAGETLIDTGGSSKPENSNLYDSLLLHAKRIGHGYALLKHPLLVEKYKEAGICLELCPISNELLHLCGNAREHPYPQLLAAGLHCTLNADNPSLFR